MATEAPDAHKPNWLMIAIFGLIGAVVIAILLSVFGDRNQAEAQSTISGIIDLNGIETVSEEAEQRGEIKIMQRQYGSDEEFTATNATVTLEDTINWVWDGAQSGTTYEIKADGYFDGKFIKSSNTIIATAPSNSQTLVINVTPEEIPGYTPPTQQTTISGIVQINGFIPSGATVTIAARGSADQDFADVVTGVPAVHNASWVWDEAISGDKYLLKATLRSGTTDFGESDLLTAHAPAANEVLRIQSTAKAPQPTPAVTKIEGSINLSGPVQQNSTILMLVREPGDTSFTAFDRLPAINGARWTYSKAYTGSSYEITASLQLNEQDIATGNTVTATAPARGEIISINTGISLPAPQGQPSVRSCGDVDAAGGFNAVLGYAKMPNAAGYYMEVGTSPGAKDIASKVIPATNDDPSLSVYVKQNTQYFTRYAFTECKDCNTYDRQNWSGWSPTLGFQCPK